MLSHFQEVYLLYERPLILFVYLSQAIGRMCNLEMLSLDFRLLYLPAAEESLNDSQCRATEAQNIQQWLKKATETFQLPKLQVLRLAVQAAKRASHIGSLIDYRTFLPTFQVCIRFLG